MTVRIAQIVQKLRAAGFDVTALNASPLWQVEGRGQLSTGQLIDLAVKLELAKLQSPISGARRQAG